MGALVRSFDWSTTPVGRMETWPQSLRTALDIMLTSRFPMFLWWGPERIQFYNDGYRPSLGANKHPSALGQRGEEGWAEIWHVIGPMIDAVFTRGESFWHEDQLIPIDRNGYLEEVFWTYSYSPIRLEDGTVGGTLVVVSETTQRVQAERRLATLRELAVTTASAKNERNACRLAAAALAQNSSDVPFSLLYLIDPDGKRARLAASAGLEAGTAAAPAQVDLGIMGHGERAEAGEAGEHEGQSEGGWPVARVARSGKQERVDDLVARFGPLAAGPWPESPSAALVLPFGQGGQAGGPASAGTAKEGDTAPRGVLVAGLSPRVPCSDAYRHFFELVAGQLTTAIHSARALELERERAEALAELDRAKTAFLSNVSHEFRTPLTLLLGPLQDALSGQRDTEGNPVLTGEPLEVAHRNALRLLRLVNALLDFSRIESGRVQASYEPVDLAALTADLASGFRSAIERAGLRFVVDCPSLDGLHEPVYVDRQMWESVVLNLLSNAFKHTFEGQIHVTLRPERDGRQVALEVRDTGIGIAAEELPRVFERFRRIRDARARTHEGSGIGLALVQELARLHGGTVTVESSVGEGTVFTVRLPTGMAHLPPERIGAGHAQATTTVGVAPFVEEALRWLPDNAMQIEELPGAETPAHDGSADEPAPATSRRTEVRILLADDNADMRRYLSRVLGQHWTVEAVADGTAALAAARAHRPDLVLMDVMMPGLDGFGVLRALRADVNARSVPVLLLSARAGEEAAVGGLEAGADDYLAKPFGAGELVARVRTHLALARARAEAEAARRRLHDLFMEAPAFICMLRGPQHIFDLTNPPYVRLLGRQDASELLGRAVRQVVPEVEGQGFFELLDRVYATGETFTGYGMPLKVDRHADGTLEEIFVDFVYQASHDIHGEIDGILVLGTEVTEQVHARQRSEALMDEVQEQLDAHVQLNAELREIGEEWKRVLAEARAAARMRDEFLSAAAHDLRTPLSSIHGHTQLLQRQAGRPGGVPADRLLSGVGQIQDAVAQMQRLVDDLVDIGHLQAGQPLPLDSQPADLVQLAQRAAGKHQQTTALHQISVEAAVPALVGQWDARRLERVLDNLLSNALKYSPDGGQVTLSVALEPPQSHEDVRWAALRVRDTGIGIPAAELPGIFDHFSRASNVQDDIRGSGIGLASVRQIVEQHGGAVSVESEEGKGSTFTVRLPL